MIEQENTQDTGLSDVLNILVQSAVETFEAFLHCQVTKGSVHKTTHTSPEYNVSFINELSGIVKGIMIITLPRKTAVEVAKTVSKYGIDNAVFFIEGKADHSAVAEQIIDSLNLVVSGITDKVREISASKSIDLNCMTVNHILGESGNLRQYGFSQYIVINFHIADKGVFALELGMTLIPKNELMARKFFKSRMSNAGEK